MRILALPEVRQYLYELSELLYKKDYFGYLENVEKYVSNFFEDIENNLLINRRRRKQPLIFFPNMVRAWLNFRECKLNCVSNK